MAKIKEIIQYLEIWAPPVHQEDYDNSGLITGDVNVEVSGILISLDCIEKVVQEAIDKNCNMVIAHHPIIFRGLKQLTGKTYVERTVIMAIRHDISIYAIHTNLDHIATGVNKKIADRLGLKETKILRAKNDTLCKLTTFIPKPKTEEVMTALHHAGAGMIGNYHHCSFRLSGTGTFLPLEDANPTIGSVGALEKVNEERIEVLFPSHLKQKILDALFKAHPYEEVAYYLHDLQNQDREIGAGMIGELEKPINIARFPPTIENKV
jgi:dinuclear metal center YbgI/SA1388 family protein